MTEDQPPEGAPVAPAHPFEPLPWPRWGLRTTGPLEREPVAASDPGLSVPTWARRPEPKPAAPTSAADVADPDPEPEFDTAARDDDGRFGASARSVSAHGAPQPVPASPTPSTSRPVPPAPAERRPATVLAVANQKGGVGKTTTAVSVAAAIAETGAQVLLVDLDPQGNASSGLGMRPKDDQSTVYDVLIDDLDMLDAVRPATVRNLFLAPANIELAGAEIELVSAFTREQRLRRALDSVREDYDLIVIDCPPSLGLLTVNALTAADGLLVPIQCEYYALEGLGALRRNADLVRANLNPSLEIVGFVLTMLDGRTRLSQQVVEEVRNHFGDKVFNTRIPRSVRLAEAPGFGEPITVFDSGSRGAMAYRRLARELLERLEATHLPPTLLTEGSRS